MGILWQLWGICEYNVAMVGCMWLLRDEHGTFPKFPVSGTVEPRYNEVHVLTIATYTCKITLLYQVSHYIRVQNVTKEI